MKKCLCLLLMLSLVLLLSSCAKSASARVVSMIDALPEATSLTLSDEDAVSSARAAYEELSEGDQAKVTNLLKLRLAEAIIASLKDSRGATDVIALIDALPTEITLAAEDAVKAAEKAYQALSEGERKKVTNASVLTQARTTLTRLAQEKTDAEAVTAVESLIAAIPLTVTLADEEVIADAASAYEALSASLKERVPSRDRLASARARLELLQAEQALTEALEPVQRAIALIPLEVTLADADVIHAAEDLYRALTADEQARVDDGARLESAILTLSTLESAYAHVSFVIAEIARLPLATDVTSADAPRIRLVMIDYSRLSLAEQDQVTNHELLVSCARAAGVIV